MTTVTALNAMLVGSVCAMKLHMVRGANVIFCKTSALEEGSMNWLDLKRCAQVCYTKITI